MLAPSEQSTLIAIAVLPWSLFSPLRCVGHFSCAAIKHPDKSREEELGKRRIYLDSQYSSPWWGSHVGKSLKQLVTWLSVRKQRGEY